jgi:Pyruvate phosphate dikinase, AMP/ATP-binding domain
MRSLLYGFAALATTAGILFLAPQLQSNSGTTQRSADGRPEAGGAPRNGFPPGGPGQFGPPPPPAVSAIDADANGEISTAEMENAGAALLTLDKNKDGELTRDELMPDFGRGGFPFPGGGPPGGFGGRGGGFGGDSNATPLTPEEVEFKDGAAAIPDHATYHKLSYRGDEVMIDTFLAGLEFVKFTLDNAASDSRQLYFINTGTHRAHMMFGRAVGLSRGRGTDQMKGVLVYRPMLKSASGEAGLYTFEFEPFDAYTCEMVKICQDALVGKMPVLQGRLGYYPRGERALSQVDQDRALYEDSSVTVYRDADLINTDVAFLPVNPGTSFGMLRLMEPDERHGPRDIVLYRSLPNEMPRSAGIITSVRQTPLSHVNLRAVQDRVPNAFIIDAETNETIRPLIGKFVSYNVTPDGYELREVSREEVDRHFATMRPSESQFPPRDLNVTKVRPLSEIRFEDSASVGAKAANVAVLGTFGFPPATVPDGFAIPFSFYDEFMQHNDFYEYVTELLANAEFQNSRDVQDAELKKLRALIKKGKMPATMMQRLDQLQNSFSDGTSLRCRSSTNNEDLPGFSGAGLYDSYTHKPDEGHLSKTVKQVFASLWNFRAFEEREFYRVDHLTAAMGVLVHPNFTGELANGVAVTNDILYQTRGNYYVNTQVGEDLVTNPEQESIPEEILLDWWDSSRQQVMRTSNRSSGEGKLLSDAHLEQLRKHLAKVHGKFARLYERSAEDPQFAMEIEFKITKDGRLAIKQARPWVFSETVDTQSEL